MDANSVLKRTGRSDEALRNRSRMSWRRHPRLGCGARRPLALPGEADSQHPPRDPKLFAQTAPDVSEKA